MKVCEVLDQSEWENVEAPKDWQTREKVRTARWKSLANEDNVVMWRLDDLVKRYPDDILVRVHPSDYDENCNIDWRDIEDPPAYEAKPDDWEVFKVEDTWFFAGEIQHKEGWDDVYERFFVRKTCPQLAAVKFMIDRHNKIAKMRSNMWRYPH